MKQDKTTRINIAVAQSFRCSHARRPDAVLCARSVPPLDRAGLALYNVTSRRSCAGMTWWGLSYGVSSSRDRKSGQACGGHCTSWQVIAGAAYHRKVLSVEVVLLEKVTPHEGLPAAQVVATQGKKRRHLGCSSVLTSLGCTYARIVPCGR